MNTAPPRNPVVLRNAELQCEIATLGAELRSLRDARSGEEFIWQRDPAFWVGSAPILFPVIGRMKDGGYTLDGRFYEIPKHGFARDLEFTVVASSETSATLQLADSAKTRAAYPFAYLLQVTFALRQRTLHVDYRLTNRNDRVMPFALGSHPAFALPPALGAIEDWSIVFDAVEEPVCHRVAENLLSSKAEAFSYAANNAIELSNEIFERDALIFKNIRSRRLQIVHREHGVRVDFDTGGAPVLGIWAKPGAPYVCLEPWCGYDDTSEINSDIFEKPGMLRLAAGKEFATGYSVTV
ncbi:MAG: aldose 1-epimerase family protein [Usitatibacteraceae bacterium]